MLIYLIVQIKFKPKMIEDLNSKNKKYIEDLNVELSLTCLTTREQ